LISTALTRRAGMMPDAFHHSHEGARAGSAGFGWLVKLSACDWVRRCQRAGVHAERAIQWRTESESRGWELCCARRRDGSYCAVVRAGDRRPSRRQRLQVRVTRSAAPLTQLPVGRRASGFVQGRDLSRNPGGRHHIDTAGFITTSLCATGFPLSFRRE
jgi:hypothetical protein